MKKAKENNSESAVVTFHPHPTVVLRNAKDVKYITPLREKQAILQKMNVDRLYIITFNKELSQLSPQDFIDHFIIGLHIKHLVAGFDYTYGHKGAGNMTVIKDQTRGSFDYTVIDKMELDNEKISSTKIRELMKNGDISGVNNLLNRPLSFFGTVIDGEKRGRELGFPTANLQVDPNLLFPRTGIYAVKVIYKNETYEGMASLGTNPTFSDGEALSFEVNIFDYNNDLYGEELIVQWHQFIRDEKKFESADALIEQMKVDEKNIRRYFKLRAE
ncbi:riboflavin biosynthesis protein RibF [Virgibacillus halophilus]|uniref:Riboflavin biosynthesis protein n=1 Tax=Tigheibacillus halophilus TaxID=361280 RepID=A0ABU5CAP7_9BACI|nr:riboflavin biosynthesis protein RibF [Virgibacillus halophilus]